MLNTVSPGRPSTLSETTIAEIEKFYKYNIPAVEVARYFGVARQRIYYYYKKFNLSGVPRQAKPTLSSVLSGGADAQKA